MYITLKGQSLPLTRKLWRGIKRCARNQFSGSDELFESCWRQYRSFVNGATDDPTELGDVTDWLEQIASEKVNSSSSKFYIYG